MKKFYNKNSAPVDNYSFYSKNQTREIYGIDQEGEKQRQEVEEQEFIENFSEQEKNKRHYLKLMDDIGMKKPSWE